MINIFVWGVIWASIAMLISPLLFDNKKFNEENKKRYMDSRTEDEIKRGIFYK